MTDPWSMQLQEQFSSDEWPTFLTVEKGEDCCVLTIKVHAKIRWFEGHFPGQPVLAGVVQTHWAGELCRWIFDIQEEFQGMDNVKFQTVIVPEKDLTLRFDYNREKNVVAFKYFDSVSSYSEGKLAFASQ